LDIGRPAIINIDFPGPISRILPVRAAGANSLAPRTLCAAALASLALACGGCGAGEPSPGAIAPGAPIEIGYLASLSGVCAPFAREYVRGAELAVARIDGRGGVLGHELRLVVRDDRGSPTVGERQARALVGSEHVRFLAGTCSSAVAKGIGLLVANPSHVLYVVGASDPTIFEAGPGSYVFGLLPTSTVEAQGAAAYVRARPRWRRVAVLVGDYSYGYELSGAFIRALAGSGRQIVSSQFLPSGVSNYVKYLKEVRDARPDVIYTGLVGADATTFDQDAFRLDIFKETKIFGIMDYAKLAGMAKAPAGAYGYTYYPSASVYRTPFATELKAALGAKAAAAGAAGEGFDEVQTIAQGIAKAGTTAPAAVRDALGGATVRIVQGDVEIHRCDHLAAVPVAMGPVVGPTGARPFAHLEPLRLVDINRYFDC
jgi:branched-chain amino acid transport system substrate-binding protein